MTKDLFNFNNYFTIYLFSIYYKFLFIFNIILKLCSIVYQSLEIIFALETLNGLNNFNLFIVLE